MLNVKYKLFGFEYEETFIFYRLTSIANIWGVFIPQEERITLLIKTGKKRSLLFFFKLAI